jgi:glycosyltransferase involved in cell wall biosynthesis
VAVVTVVRDGRATLERNLVSVREQTHAPLDHIVIDGGSTDGTLDLLRSQADRLRWTSGPDQGVYDAMNKGVAMVRSPEDYVLFLNADDAFHAPDALERVMRETRGEDVICTLLERYDAELDYRDVFGREPTLRDLRLGVGYAHQAMLCRRRVFDAVGGFDLRYRISSDYDWIVRVFQRGEFSRRFVPVVLAVMRRGGLSERAYLRLVAERGEIVRRRFSTLEWLQYRAHSVVADHLKYGALRILRRLGLLNRAREGRRQLREWAARRKTSPA